MEPVTHILFGTVLGRAGLNRKSGLATGLLALAAEAPDMDIMMEIKGPVAGFHNHRGYTHTFLGVPFDAAIVVAAVYLIYRWRKRSGWTPKLPPRWGLLYLFACLGALSHILLDFTNAYGVRPFMPFSYHWYHWDIVSIIEPVMLIALVGGLLVPRLFALIQEEIGARRSQGRLAATLALVAIAAMWGLRDYEHRRAVAALEAFSYDGGEPLRVSAFPYDTNPFIWHGVVETETFIRSLPVDSLRTAVDPESKARTYYKPEDSPVLEAARSSYLGRVYLDWAAYPLMQVEPTQDGYEIRFMDIRYLYPERRRPVLSAAVFLDRNLEPVAERFGGIASPRRIRPLRAAPER